MPAGEAEVTRRFAGVAGAVVSPDETTVSAPACAGEYPLPMPSRSA